MELTLIYTTSGNVSRALAEHFGKHVSLAKNERGAPYLEDDPHYISISHKDHRLVIALSDSPVGVDIERMEDKPTLYCIARRYFPEQIEEGDCTSFYRSWTRREAYGKLLVVGLSMKVMGTDMRPDCLDHEGKNIYFVEHQPDANYLVTLASYAQEVTAIKEVL